MEKYILSCCSTADLTKEHFDKRNIRYICFHYYLGETEYPDRYEQTIKAVPMGRFADPETDIGRLCIFLSSEDAAYITGETITVQGGSGLRP